MTLPVRANFSSRFILKRLEFFSGASFQVSNEIKLI